MTPLSNAIAGDVVKVVEIHAGKGLKLRLEQLGLFPGSLVEVLSNNKGHVLIKAQGAIISLSKGIASKIFIDKAQK